MVDAAILSRSIARGVLESDTLPPENASGLGPDSRPGEGGPVVR